MGKQGESKGIPLYHSLEEVQYIPHPQSSTMHSYIPMQ